MSFSRALQCGPMERQVRSLWRAHQNNEKRTWRQRWRLWNLLREFDFTPPDPSSWPLQFPEQRIPDCASCQDNCCKGPHNTVLLRLVDVALFVDKGWTDQMTHDKPTFDEATLAARPMLRAMTQSFHWRVFPVLRQKADQTCTFLDAEGRCTIHVSRPWICRVFPYVLDIDNEAIGWSPRCQWYREVPEEEAQPIAQELHHAVFHNFYTEKICDLTLTTVYWEELQEMGLAGYLRLE
ncbi:MAG: YkgJ family cysteine cluster protein [Deltaproteobacteria bacterium]|nr:MAG: YkgJ family cysteine cluster protein [Deltaproteobacteria bacterium]